MVVAALVLLLAAFERARARLFDVAVAGLLVGLLPVIHVQSLFATGDHRRGPGGDPLASRLAALRRGGGGGRRAAGDPAPARAPRLRRPRQPVPLAGAGLDVRSGQPPPRWGTPITLSAPATAIGDTLPPSLQRHVLVLLAGQPRGGRARSASSSCCWSIGRTFGDRSIGRAGAARVLGIVPAGRLVRFFLACIPVFVLCNVVVFQSLGLGQHQAARLLVPGRRPGGGGDHRPPLGGMSGGASWPSSSPAACWPPAAWRCCGSCPTPPASASVTGPYVVASAADLQMASVLDAETAPDCGLPDLGQHRRLLRPGPDAHRPAGGPRLLPVAVELRAGLRPAARPTWRPPWPAADPPPSASARRSSGSCAATTSATSR